MTSSTTMEPSLALKRKRSSIDESAASPVVAATHVGGCPKKVRSKKLEPSPEKRTPSGILPGQWDDDEATDDMRRQKAIYYRQAYRMTPDHFWRLYGVLSPHMKEQGLCKPDDKNDTGRAFRLSAALRHFAGGESAKDHGIADPEVLDGYVWEVVEAIHKADELSIEFPSCHEIQQEMATCFELLKSDIGLSSCVGSLGSMLVWTEKPNEAGIASAEYFNENKKKFGLNMQGICDHNGRFMGIDVSQPGSVADLDAFTVSSLSCIVTAKNFLAEDLALYGGESYSQSPLVVTPLPPGIAGEKQTPSAELVKDYNFHQRQCSRVIDSAFTTLLQRWGLLRRALPAKMGLAKQRSLVRALCMLHNFCLGDMEPMLSSLTRDLVYNIFQGSVFAGDAANCELLNCDRPTEILLGSFTSDGQTASNAPTTTPKHAEKCGAAKIAQERALEVLRGEQVPSSQRRMSISFLHDTLHNL